MSIVEGFMAQLVDTGERNIEGAFIFLVAIDQQMHVVGV
jgi:hypothetical protein